MSIVIDGTTGIVNIDGNASSPAITGTDTDTGVFFSTNTLGLSVGGTERMTLDASGNLGIGKSSTIPAQSWRPGTYLTVSNSSTRGEIELDSNIADSSSATLGGLVWSWSTQTTNHKNIAVIEVDAEGGTANQRGSAMKFFTKSNGTAAPAERARIDSSGNLLVGTTVHQNYSGSTTEITLGTTATGTNAGGAITFSSGSGLLGYIGVQEQETRMGTYTSSPFALVTDSTPRIWIRQSTGYVGIASSDPWSKLHVDGSSSDSIVASSPIFKVTAGGDGWGFGVKASSPYVAWAQAGYQSPSYSPTFNGGYPMALQPYGNILMVGTTVPSGDGYKLEVNGGIRTNGQLFAHEGLKNSKSSPTSTYGADSCIPGYAGSFGTYLTTGTSAQTGNSTPGGDGHIWAATWNSTTGYGAQLYIDTDPTNAIAVRTRSGAGSWQSWTVL